MITALHTLVYANDPEAARAFFRDVLGWAHIDAHDGWLIFKGGPSELAVHPTSGARGGEGWATDQHHEIALMCHDVETTVAELKARGAEFSREIRDDGFGLTTMLKIPGATEMLLYQPRHLQAHSL